MSGGIQGWVLRGEEGITAAVLGSFVAETVAEAISPTGGLGKLDAKDRPVYSQDRTQLTQDVARLTASMAALLAGMDEKDIAIAINTATTAVEYNFAASARKMGEGPNQVIKQVAHKKCLQN